VEAETFESRQLDGVTRRDYALGQLARVFQQMTTEVWVRERRLQQTVRKLRIESDEVTAALGWPRLQRPTTSRTSSARSLSFV